jgi:spermidine synthase
MIEAWRRLAEARLPDGSELVLRGRGAEFEIRMNGQELMASRAHRSEAELARLGCTELAGRAGARVLVGGLGLGYTLRAALDALPADAAVVVAELVPEIIAWNRGPLGPLAGHPLDDPRVSVAPGDVAALLQEQHDRFDAILLDVDNGADGRVRGENSGLCAASGLAMIARALRRPGMLAVWSADEDDGFLRRLCASGYAARAEAVPAHDGPRAPLHTIFLAILA